MQGFIGVLLEDSNNNSKFKKENHVLVHSSKGSLKFAIAIDERMEDYDFFKKELEICSNTNDNIVSDEKFFKKLYDKYSDDKDTMVEYLDLYCNLLSPKELCYVAHSYLDYHNPLKDDVYELVEMSANGESSKALKLIENLIDDNPSILDKEYKNYLHYNHWMENDLLSDLDYINFDSICFYLNIVLKRYILCMH